MLIVVALFLSWALYLTHRERGPVWAMAISWLACMAPLICGAISFPYMSADDLGYPATVTAFLACYVVGSRLQRFTTHRGTRASPHKAFDEWDDFRRTLPYAKICWWAGCAGAACLCIDFAMLDGAGLNDMA